MGVRVLGVDPGFSKIGLFGIVLGADGPGTYRLQLITTKKSSKKQRLHVYDDDHRRLEEIEASFAAFLFNFKPDLVAAEQIPSLRSAKTTRQIALAYGAMHALVRQSVIPWRSYDPKEIKRAVAGKSTASKEEVLDAVRAFFPHVTWPKTKQVEHIADAAAAAMTVRRDHLVEVLLKERT